MTGGEDGLLRGVGIFPNHIVGVLGQHEEDQQFPITKIDMDHTKRIVASISHDNSIKFYDVVEFMRKRANSLHVEPNEEQFSSKAQVEKAQMSEEDEEEDDEEEDSEDDDEQDRK